MFSFIFNPWIYEDTDKTEPSLVLLLLDTTVQFFCEMKVLACCRFGKYYVCITGADDKFYVLLFYDKEVFKREQEAKKKTNPLKSSH